MHFIYCDYLVAIIGSISMPITTFFSRRRIYETWAKVASLLICIFGVSWGVTGFIRIHYESSISSNTDFIFHSVRSSLVGACIGLLLCLIIVKPYKKVTLEKPQPSA